MHLHKREKRTVTKLLKENKTKTQGTEVFINKHVDRKLNLFQLSCGQRKLCLNNYKKALFEQLQDNQNANVHT